MRSKEDLTVKAEASAEGVKSKRFSIWTVAAMAVLALVGFIWVPPLVAQLVPAQAEFRDLTGDKIRSDGDGAYVDVNAGGQDCVRCYVSFATGFAFMRTGGGSTYSGGFSTCVPVNPRELTLDFSVVAPGEPTCTTLAAGLVCGANSIPDAKVRAGNPFKRGATAAEVSIAFNLDTSFPQTGNAFVLRFEQAVPVSGSGSVRILEAGEDAVAELYQIDRVGKKTSETSLGRFKMPFQATFTELP
jgi:hypothetical protein